MLASPFPEPRFPWSSKVMATISIAVSWVSANNMARLLIQCRASRSAQALAIWTDARTEMGRKLAHVK